jgi:hypothetical protein
LAFYTRVERKALKKYANNGECPGDGGRKRLIPRKTFNLVGITGPLPNQRFGRVELIENISGSGL